MNRILLTYKLKLWKQKCGLSKHRNNPTSVYFRVDFAVSLYDSFYYSDMAVCAPYINGTLKHNLQHVYLQTGYSSPLDSPFAIHLCNIL